MKCSFYIFFRVIVLVILLKIPNMYGQDVNFTMPYHSPLELNPAYAGSEKYWRFGANYQNSWSALGEPYEAYSFFTDYYFPKSKSGIGFSALNDRQMDGVLKQTSLALSYAYNLRVAQNTALRFGIQATLRMAFVNSGQLLFPDMIDPSFGATGGTVLYDKAQQMKFDMPIGCVFSHHNFYMGLAGRFLFNTNNATIDDVQILQSPKITLNMGYNIEFGTRLFSYSTHSTSSPNNYNFITLSPCIHYHLQSLYQNFSVGTYLRLSQFVSGVFYRTTPQFSFHFFSAMLGYTFKAMVISYAFEAGVLDSKMQGALPTTHEISLLFNIKYKMKEVYGVRVDRSNIQNSPPVNFL
ncbi:MAG: PorP/SprF family type IX secretion system membrane protein [Bacteroidales bacterium]